MNDFNKLFFKGSKKINANLLYFCREINVYTYVF